MAGFRGVNIERRGAGRRQGGGSDASFVRGVWNLGASARGYRRFLSGFCPLVDRASGVSARDAFTARFAVVLAYLAAAWPDPELPPSLLPADWPGPSARSLAADLYRALLPGALAHGDAIAALV